jgi:drug/metabolite transporter (DMT)-like permease
MTEQRKGELIILSQTFIWGAFPIVTILSYAKLSSWSTLAWSMFFAGLFFAGIMTYRKTWHELRNPVLWQYVLMAVLFIGVLYYGLYFTGLTKTTAGNSGIIALFEIFTSYIFFHLIRKDHIPPEHIVGALLMIAGAAIVLSPNFSQFNAGDILILAATFFAPVGNFFTQKARKIASSESIMFLRCALTVPAIILLSYALSSPVSFADARSALGFLLLNGIIIFGVSKLMWVEGIHRISVTKALSLSSIAPLFTLAFAWAVFHQAPSGWQLVSLIPLLFGVYLLTDQIKFRNRS